MQDFSQIIGRRVRNNGDVCNAPRNGVVTAVNVDRWGTFAVVTYDEAKTIGWDRDGEPVDIVEASTVIPLHNIDAPGTRYSRFIFAA